MTSAAELGMASGALAGFEDREGLDIRRERKILILRATRSVNSLPPVLLLRFPALFAERDHSLSICRPRGGENLHF